MGEAAAVPPNIFTPRLDYPLDMSRFCVRAISLVEAFRGVM